MRLDAQHDTVWLSLQQLADLFERDKSAISRHLNNIFKEGELDRAAVVAKNATTAAYGKTYQVGELEPAATVSILETVRLEGQRQVRHFAPYSPCLQSRRARTPEHYAKNA